MRCKICDFSPDVPSMFHSGLTMPKRIKMSEDPETGEIVCNCFSHSEGEDADEDGSLGVIADMEADR